MVGLKANDYGTASSEVKVKLLTPPRLVMNLFKHTIPLLVRPRHEWLGIATETTTPRMLYLGYIIPLSGISPIATKIRLIEEIQNNPDIEPQLVEFLYWGATWPGLISNYVCELIEISLLAFLLNLAAPLFSGERNQIQALKVMAFSLTSMWLGEIFLAIPMFSLDRSMTLLSGIYTVYLLYLGIAVLMKVTYPRTLVYTALVVTAFWGVSKVRRAAVPAIMDFLRQWPVLDQGTKTMVLIPVFLSLVGFVVFLAYRGRQKVM